MAQKRITILMLIGKLDIDSGGAQHILLDIISNSDRQQFEFTVCHMSGSGSLGIRFPTDVEIVGLNAYNKFKFNPAILLALKKLFAKKQIDIVHTHSPISGTWGRIAAKLFKIPFIVSTEHSVRQRYRPIARYVNGLTLGFADCVIGVSESVTNSILWWERALLSKGCLIRTIYNGIDIAKAVAGMKTPPNKKRREFGFDSNNIIIGNVGKLTAAKGQEYLIRAFKIVASSYPHARLLIIGRGEMEKELLRLTYELGLGEKVIFTGGRTDVYDILPILDVFALPSIYEGFGIALLEAMIANVPIVCTAIPAVKEVVGNTAYTVPKHDPDALAETIIKIIENPQDAKERASQARERVKSKFSVTRTADQYCRVYQELLKA